MMAVIYRQLTGYEEQVLKDNGCSAEDWSRVRVVDGFIPDRIMHVAFYGDIRLGIYAGEVVPEGLPAVKCGLYNCEIRNCEIGDGCYISNVGLLSGYQISQGCFIREVRQIYMDGSTSFGNGTEVSVMDETGGRKIPIYNKLSSVLAYAAVFYRYRDDLLKTVQHLVADYASSITTRHGYIGIGVRLEFSTTIVNVRIGDYARIKGAVLLENGSINSLETAPVSLSEGIIARNFILSCGSRICNGVTISECFIGEACCIQNGFTLKDSLVFADSCLEGGEARSVFAAPYTESVYKSTVLAGGLFSFFRAGASCSQSCDGYRLEPWHMGIADRGVIFLNGTKVCWPARIGSYSRVSGNIAHHPDTSDFPFSDLVETAGKIYLVPGAVLESVGLLSDQERWNRNDCRKAPEPIDAISFDVLSPYTVYRMFEGRRRLEELKDSEKKTGAYFRMEGMLLAEGELERGIELYTLAIRTFLADRLPEGEDNGGEENFYGLDKWVDAAGLLLPKDEMDYFIQFLLLEPNLNITKVYKKICEIHAGYDKWSRNWAKTAAVEEFGGKLSRTEILEKCRKAKLVLCKSLLNDAVSEFSGEMDAAFGLDGNPQDRAKDLESVRGVLEDHPLICSLLEEIVNLEEQ